MTDQFVFEVKAMTERGTIRSVRVIAESFQKAIENARLVFDKQNDPMHDIINTTRRGRIVEVPKL